MGIWSLLAFIKTVANKYPKYLFAITVISACLFSTYYVHHKFDNLTQEHILAVTQISRLENEKAQLKEDLNISILINRENQKVLDLLAISKRESDSAAAKLVLQLSQNKSKYEVMSSAVRNSSLQDDAPLAPVLANALKNLQENRE